MRTIQDILSLFPGTSEADWKQHTRGRGWVQITATVEASCRIEGIVSGNARVFGDAWVSGNAQVFGNARVSGNARVFGDAWVSGDAWVFGDAWVSGDAWVFGDAWVSGNARVFGDAWVSGNAWESSPLQIQGSKHFVTNCKFGHISIGCHVHTFAEWKANYRAIGKENGYTPVQIREYKGIIDLICKFGK